MSCAMKFASSSRGAPVSRTDAIVFTSSHLGAAGSGLDLIWLFVDCAIDPAT
jgi:hypothetical protein